MKEKISAIREHINQMQTDDEESVIRKRWRSPGSSDNRWGFRGLLLMPMQFFSKDGEIYNV